MHKKKIKKGIYVEGGGAHIKKKRGTREAGWKCQFII